MASEELPDVASFEEFLLFGILIGQGRRLGRSSPDIIICFEEITDRLDPPARTRARNLATSSRITSVSLGNLTGRSIVVSWIEYRTAQERPGVPREGEPAGEPAPGTGSAGSSLSRIRDSSLDTTRDVPAIGCFPSKRNLATPPNRGHFGRCWPVFGPFPAPRSSSAGTGRAGERAIWIFFGKF